MKIKIRDAWAFQNKVMYHSEQEALSSLKFSYRKFLPFLEEGKGI